MVVTWSVDIVLCVEGTDPLVFDHNKLLYLAFVFLGITPMHVTVLGPVGT